MNDLTLAEASEAAAVSLRQQLNDHPFTTDSIEGWILLLLILFLAWNLCRRAFEFAGWACAAIFMVQVLYFLGQTGFGDIIPIGEVFRYDILSAIAQTCVGTPLCDFLLKANGCIRHIIMNTWQVMCGR